jgi:surfactin synthase thioesterase subunit
MPQLEPPLGGLQERSEDYLYDYLRKMGGTSPELLANAELMAMMMPILRADFGIRDHYQFGPGPTLACALTALGGEADPHISSSDLLGWQALTTGPFAMRQWPGGHFYLQREQAGVLQTIADALPA